MELGFFMENEETQTQMRKYADHLDRYRDSLIVRRVLVGDTTFKKEVEEFYGLLSHMDSIDLAPTGPPIYYRVYEVMNKDDKNGGKIPLALIELIQPFSKESLRIQRLEYEKVREDYLRWNNLTRKFVPKFILGKPKGTNHEWVEYLKLNNATRKADLFMEDYRKHFIRRVLEEDV